MIYYSPMAIKAEKKAVRDCIARFDETGRSGPHSPMGGILCHILNHCIKTGVSFELKYLAGGGYSLERKDWNTPSVEYSLPDNLVFSILNEIETFTGAGFTDEHPHKRLLLDIKEAIGAES